MATDQPPTPLPSTPPITPSSVMGPDVLASLPVIRAEVAKTLAALERIIHGSTL